MLATASCQSSSSIGTLLLVSQSLLPVVYNSLVMLLSHTAEGALVSAVCLSVLCEFQTQKVGLLKKFIVGVNIPSLS